ncbi:MAG: hypothetical protein ABR582_00715 [Gemmatimonadaceae bacterium]
MIVKIFFLSSFVIGLGLGVYSMLHGVESPKGGHTKRPSAIFNAPSLSTFTIVSGAVSYLLVTQTTLALVPIVAIGSGTAFIATTMTAVFLARWALPHSGDENEADTLQGLIARVTRSISPSSPGEIAFLSNGTKRTIAAQGIEQSVIPTDTEVVIDRIQNGVARVELWSTVEQRL